MRNMANVNGQRKPEHSVYSPQHSIASTHVAQALPFLLPSKLGQGIARSAIGHPVGGRSPQALDPLTWLRLFLSCSQASLGRKTKNPDSNAVRACGLR
jgi:hypothetical protein